MQQFDVCQVRKRQRMLNPQHHFSIGVVDISLRSACRSFLEEYLSLYAPYAQGSVGANAIEVEIKAGHRYPWRRGPFTLHSDGVQDVQVKHHYEVLPHLEWYINAQIIRNRRDYLQLHASSVEIGGRAMILVGDPGSGKSTLTAGLLSNGWSYLCDEFALIDPETRLIHPYPRALCIKEPSFPVIDSLGLPLCRKTPYQKATKGRVAFLNPLDVRPDVVGKPSPVRWVIFPRYVADAPPALQRMTRSEGAHELARQCFNARVFEARAVHILNDVVRGAECYRLRSAEISATCQLLQRLVQSGRSRRAQCA